jgi:D-alanyl-lipoteichoic acid acyltransferase DltB (MBOAT superfamily)
MALGTARLFNIRLTNNFNSPYLATSVADFWRRWHITFSRWILDYIFKPLQMAWRNGKEWGTAAALLVTFLVSGVWHGASWGFIVWGLLHGTYMACAVFWRPYQKRLHKALHLEKTKLLRVWQVLVTFHLVCFAWIFFRAGSLREVRTILSHINFTVHAGRPIDLKNLGIIAVAMMFVIIHRLYRNGFPVLTNAFNRAAVRWTVYFLLFYFTLLFYCSVPTDYIYFRF